MCRSPEKKKTTIMCTQVQHGTKEYDETVALRYEVLRKPLGLKFSPQELAQEKNSFHLACWRNSMLVACLVLKPLSARQLRMRQFAVHPDFQGKGVGRALTCFSESFATTHGYEEIVLHAREKAAGFYKKLGYQIEGDRFIEVTIPHFSMWKSLLNNGEQAAEPHA